MSYQFKKSKLQLFFNQKRACVGFFLFICLFIIATFAPFISNNKPIILISNNNSHRKIYFPILKDYSPQDFGIENEFIMNYKDFVKNNLNYTYIFPINTWDPDEQTEEVLVSPSKLHFFGTDNLGRDICARLIFGIRTSLFFGLLIWFISFFVGVFLGAMQGYLIGIFDFVLERLKELTAIIPTLTLIILVTSMLKKQSFFLILCLVLIFAWIGISSQIRATVLSLRAQDYCVAAKALGASHFRILSKHILANALVPIVTLSPFAIEGGISLLAGLDYLGFGMPPPTASLGELLSQGREHLQTAPWVIIAPIISILCLLISVNLIGQALRQAFDPKS